MKVMLILILLLRLSLGLFWIDHGIDKVNSGWLTENKLKLRLVKANITASGATKSYLKHFAIPASGVLRYFVTFGELAVGLAFLAGFWMKPAAWGAVFMVLNFKFADSRLWSLEVFGDAYVFPLLLAGLAVAYFAFGAEWTVRRFLPALERYDL
ncbi:MAG: DoxX family protein [Fidelibacterota bacterium]|nr:MAG: DoxX family protein [Candidatus Neomarinimicrobiota bacterium]